MATLNVTGFTYSCMNGYRRYVTVTKFRENLLQYVCHLIGILSQLAFRTGEISIVTCICSNTGHIDSYTAIMKSCTEPWSAKSWYTQSVCHFLQFFPHGCTLTVDTLKIMMHISADHRRIGIYPCQNKIGRSRLKGNIAIIQHRCTRHICQVTITSGINEDLGRQGLGSTLILYMNMGNDIILNSTA